MKPLTLKIVAWTLTVLLLAVLSGLGWASVSDVYPDFENGLSTSESSAGSDNSCGHYDHNDHTEDFSENTEDATASTTGDKEAADNDSTIAGSEQAGDESHTVENSKKPVGSGSSSTSWSPSTTSGHTANKPNGKPSGGTTTTTAAATTAATSATKPKPTTKPTTTTSSPTPTGKIIAGYYAGWSAYKGYTPARVPAESLTHLHYAFAKIDSKTKKIALADASQDKKNFAELRKLKQSNPHLKTLISVGGWDYSTYFSDVAASASAREVFAQSCVDFIVEHGFDGVDIDWEYPVSGGLAGNSNRPQDKQNFTLLLQAIRNKLDQQEKKAGRDYYLTIAGAANTSYLSKIEPQAVAGLVDYIFVMTYDMHGPWDSYADFNAPLYTPAENSPQYKNSVYDGIMAYRNQGVSAKKLVLGMPFYGYLYQGVSSDNGGLYSRFTSAKAVTYDVIRSSYLGNTAYTQRRHSVAQVPYLSGNRVFLSYEDPMSISAKASLAKSLGLAGVGAWELSQDTSGALLKSAYNTIL